MPLAATRYTLEERRFIASQMYVFERPTQVRRNFAEQFRKDPPSRLSIYRIYQKWKETGSVTNNISGVSGRRRTVRIESNIINVQRALQRN